MKKLWYNILYLQGDDAMEPLKILDRRGFPAVVQYLRQWETFEEYDPYDHSPRGQKDDYVLVTFGGILYELTWSTAYSFIGLCRIEVANESLKDTLASYAAMKQFKKSYRGFHQGQIMRVNADGASLRKTNVHPLNEGDEVVILYFLRKMNKRNWSVEKDAEDVSLQYFVSVLDKDGRHHDVLLSKLDPILKWTSTNG